MSDDAVSEIPVVSYDREAFEEVSRSYADEDGGPQPWSRSFARRVVRTLEAHLHMLQDGDLRGEVLNDLAQVVIPLALAEEMKQPVAQQIRQLKLVVLYEDREVRLSRALVFLGKRAYADKLLLRYAKSRPSFEDLEDDVSLDEDPQDEDVEHGSLFDQDAASDD